MANIKSQKKRNLTNEKARQKNVAVRSRMRTIVKQAREALTTTDSGAIADACDRAGGRGLTKL